MKNIVVSAFALCAVAFSGVVSAETNSAVTGEYGNHCAMGLTMGKQVSTDCSINWVDTASKKTYCFSSKEMMEQWAKDTKANEAKATAEFHKVSKSHS
ncbi:MAG: hypothetical protein SGJ02_08310 [bacterium]|nr:hypothetical protein [bacterium]